MVVAPFVTFTKLPLTEISFQYLHDENKITHNKLISVMYFGLATKKGNKNLFCIYSTYKRLT